MIPFDQATAGRPLADKFNWEEDGLNLVEAFNIAMENIKKINSTVLLRPEEQLFILPDSSTHHNCLGWVLYVK